MRPQITEPFDVVVIGAGPAGQKAAIQAAKAQRRVLVVEEMAGGAGGECVRRGTIPSKTLRETAAAMLAFKARTGMPLPREAESPTLERLMSRMHAVVDAHVGYMNKQLERNGIEMWRGRARFLDASRVEVRSPGQGTPRIATAPVIVIAVGSRPRTPPEVPVDHEHVLDSDSFLSMAYLPRSLTILGAGVIASEYASIFASLGTEVTMIDRGPRPLAFLDEELGAVFTKAFQRGGGEVICGTKAESVTWNGVDAVLTRLPSGREIRSERVLCALGRVASLGHLDIGAAGLAPNERGLLSVDEHGMTSAPGIYAVGDVVGPPALASAAMEQGRRAMRHALGLPDTAAPERLPMAIYTLPEMASVGLGEAEARERFGGVVVGRAHFDEIARGHISAAQEGLLKIVCDPTGRDVLGVHIAGEGAAELVHVGQMAMLGRMPVDTFVDNVFNFPTLAEAYRVAAFDVVAKRRAA